MKAKILIVEDDPLMADRCAIDLSQWNVTMAATGGEALDQVRRYAPDVVVLDLLLPDINGMEILKTIQDEDIPSRVVVITSQASVRLAVDALKAGACDFLVKPFTSQRLKVTVRNIIETQRLDRQVRHLTEDFALPAQISGTRFIGSSAIMYGIFRMIEAAAPSRATVFITGESGTGKELCAEAIHRSSPRSQGAFIALNCAAIPRDLMESELFGHVKGAFTGAIATREGAASRADAGTLFLDEIGEMDLGLQGKLLRFLQTGLVQKVGSDTAQKVDIRVICATNRNPLRDIEEGRFREDLYYRLHVIPIHLPPLRERDGDALEIAEVLLQQLSREEGKGFRSLSRPAALAIAGYDWPGNVRQLENTLRSAIVLNNGTELALNMLPDTVQAVASNSTEGDIFPSMLAKGTVTPLREEDAYASHALLSPPRSANLHSDIKPLWLIEKDAIEAAIERCGGNIPKAAALLEVSPSTIYRKKSVWLDRGLAS